MTAPRLSADLCIPADHAAFTGHFPGFPILPGAALLDAVATGTLTGAATATGNANVA